ncbi:MAG: polyhydroxyalkanoate synthesis repressor PhaR [Proteobacteria bacterium]|nr:polyhydroxyalkanoate synthesis repressor PhaR [Pseudomonadota bacterium]
MSEDQGPSKQEQPKNATVIKKYANRRLYNTATSTYVTLEDLSRMVKEGSDFIVYDAKTGEDITRGVLTQIIFEEENKGENNLLPINFLRQLIRFYGDNMQAMVPGYLEFSMGNLLKEQEKLRNQMFESFGGDAFKAVEEQAKRNMQLFQDSLRMFTPFGSAMPNFPNPFGGGGAAPRAAASEKPSSGPSKDELQSLKEQLAAMQQKIDQLNR